MIVFKFMDWLIDTDILIDALRGSAKAIELIEDNLTKIAISVMSVAELYQGVRNTKEQKQLELTLSMFTVLPITNDIAIQAGHYSSRYKASHGTGLADCLIAGTAECHGLFLMTLNIKHYPMLRKLDAPYKK